ncbi:hypothetical protein EVAR_5362_1 [Eumeta japonica]|uniref:Uncharacterized protein n=1 Tax=Eumeta variegata TaxID=151549 RepID=A0A4C1TNR4_EUMVA|nr:hypothetical protein EVAR_5362_1 [Eumeta japonica]
MVGHMPVCFDRTAHSIDVFVVHGGGRATTTKFISEINFTTALEFCKLVISIVSIGGKKTGSTRSVKHHILTEYRREVAPSAVSFYLVSESSGDPLPLPQPTPFLSFPSLRYPSPTQEAGNALNEHSETKQCRLRLCRGYTESGSLDTQNRDPTKRSSSIVSLLKKQTTALQLGIQNVQFDFSGTVYQPLQPSSPVTSRRKSIVHGREQSQK